MAIKILSINNSVFCGLKTLQSIHARNFSIGAVALGHVNLKGRSFLTFNDLSADERKHILWVSEDLKYRIKHEKQVQWKSIAMIFEKRSTRTRISTETSFALLGGHPCFLTSKDIHLGVNESIKHSQVSQPGSARLDGECRCPAIFRSLQRCSIGFMSGLWLGHSMTFRDFSNSCHSALPPSQGYAPDNSVIQEAQRLSKQLLLTCDPVEAARGSNVLVTDTWVSLGQEEEKKQRIKDFHGYQITMQTGSVAKPDWTFLHCLPRKQEEVDDQVFYSSHSLVFPEAENRKWTIMGLMVSLLTDYSPQIPLPRF
uniref:ornithine carbamoyltransferase n=1 Tax=Hucho hucho TaxID=62062 RepID=A0A4W5JZ35_9TELE